MTLNFAEPSRLEIGLEPPYDAEPRDWPFEATKLFLYGEASLDATKAKMAVPINQLFTDGYEVQARDSAYFIYETFCAILAQIPYDHPAQLRLAYLVNELWEPAKQSAERKSPWITIPLPACRYSDAPADDMMEMEPASRIYRPDYELNDAELRLDAISDEWTRHNAFHAKLMSIIGKPYWERAALIAIGGALEEPQKSLNAISVNMPGAAVWMIYAGKQMYESREIWPDHWHWVFWRDRFKWATNEEDLADESRRLARLAVEAMEEAEEACT